MSLKAVAQETLKIIQAGKLITASGIAIDFSTEQQAAVIGTTLYTPQQLAQLLQQPSSTRQAKPIAVEVTDETTQVAAHRLVHDEGCQDLVLLNYASARNPGGGFINGAKAQEEDLTRCSGLYPCLLQQPIYNEANRNHASLIYTDHIIYAPQVPWFRTRSRNLLDHFFLASVITAPAPNAGQVLRQDPQAYSTIETALRRRAGYLLAVASDRGHRSLLLGGWGCGVFRNDPKLVADAFGKWLDAPEFQGSFDRVVFGVYDPSKTKTVLTAFQNRFAN